MKLKNVIILKLFGIVLGIFIVNIFFAFIFAKPQYAIPNPFDSCGCDYAGWGSLCVSWKPTCNHDQPYCIEGSCEGDKNEVGEKCGENEDCKSDICTSHKCAAPAFQGCETPIMSSRGKGFCESWSTGRCFWYSGGLNDSPRCVANNGDMNGSQTCRDDGHCYKDQSCQPGNYCSSSPAPGPTSTPAPTGSNTGGGADTCTETSANGTWACQNGCSAGYVDTGKTGQTYFRCKAGLTCCIKKAISVGGGTTGGGSTGGGGTTPAPTPATPSEVGYCGDSIPTLGTLKPVNGATCAATSTGNLLWKKRATDSSGYDAYCDRTSGQLQRYFYECAAGTSGGSTTPTSTPAVTPTPTTFVPISQGSVCNPVQGPWQCESPNVCLSTGSTGRCCPAGNEWRDNACKPPVQPTAGPTTTQAPANPTPISTGSTCNDYIPASNIHQVCRSNTSTCIGTEVQNSGGNGACTDSYQKPSVCCQLPPSAGPAGGACNSANRECDLGLNTSTQTNISCSGCGGYCIKNNSTGKGMCQNPY